MEGGPLSQGPLWAARNLTSLSHLAQCKVYLVEAVLMSFLLSLVKAGSPVRAQSAVRQVLDLLWLFMEVRPRQGGKVRAGHTRPSLARVQPVSSPGL